MEVVGSDGDVPPCAWMTAHLFCPRKSSSTFHMKSLQLIYSLKYRYFSTHLILPGPELLVPAMRLEENKVDVGRSNLSNMPPRSVPAMHFSEITTCVSLNATVLLAIMNDSTYLALSLDQVLLLQGSVAEGIGQRHMSRLTFPRFSLRISCPDGCSARGDQSSGQSLLCPQPALLSEQPGAPGCQTPLAAWGCWRSSAQDLK